jgi:hypothetical protein
MLGHEGSRWLGALGDFLNVLGAVVLARDALLKDKDDLRLKALKVSSTVIKLPMSYKKRVVANVEDAERVFSVFTVWRALWGCVLLFLGFCIGLVVRLWGS